MTPRPERKQVVALPEPPVEDCPDCNLTGLMPGTRRAFEDGAWRDVPTRYRKTCTTCHGTRRVEHNPEGCYGCRPQAA